MNIFDDELDLGTLDTKSEIISQVSIVHETSKSAKNGGKVGSFNVQDTDINFDKMVGVPLNVSTSRIWFMGNGSPYFCRSDNGLLPIKSDSQSYVQQAGNCQSCPKAKWKGRTSPPQCQLSMDVTFAILEPKEAPQVLKMSFKGASQKEIKRALEHMSDNGGLTRNKVILETAKMQGETFDYYVSSVTDVLEISQEEAARIAPLKAKHSPKGEVMKIEPPDDLEIEDTSFTKELTEIDLE